MVTKQKFLGIKSPWIFASQEFDFSSCRTRTTRLIRVAEPSGTVDVFRGRRRAAGADVDDEEHHEARDDGVAEPVVAVRGGRLQLVVVVVRGHFADSIGVTNTGSSAPFRCPCPLNVFKDGHKTGNVSKSETKTTE